MSARKLFLTVFLTFFISLFFPSATFAADYSLTDSGNYNFRFSGIAAGDYSSDSPAIGDFNNDGFNDFAIGGASSDVGGSNRGWLRVFWGSADMEKFPGGESSDFMHITGETNSSRLGWYNIVGDLNDDGIDDLVTTAYDYDSTLSNVGRVYVYYGGEDVDTTPELTFTGETVNEYVGIENPVIADLNGDNIDDLVISIPNNDTGGTNSGRVNIYYGGTDMDNVADFWISGTANNQNFGNNVKNADVDEDGNNDLIVAASGTDQVFVFYGYPNLDNVADIIITGSSSLTMFGEDLYFEDVTGDGHKDFIISDQMFSLGTYTFEGIGYIYSWDNGYDSTPDFSVVGSYTYNMLKIEGVGDLNNDGFNDFLTNNSDSVSSLYYGGPLLDSTADLTIQGERNSRIADLNHDGFNDLMTSDHLDDDAGTDAGKVYIYLGSETGISETPDVTFSGAVAGDQLSIGIVNPFDDFNGDEVEDFVFVAYYSDLNGTDSGVTYLILNFPHSITADSIESIFTENYLTVTGLISASDSITDISGVQYSLNDNDFDAEWHDCTPVDDTFDSKEEEFSCSLTNLSDGEYTIYLRAKDENSFYTASANYYELETVIDAIPDNVSVNVGAEIEINGGAKETADREVKLSIRKESDSEDITWMMICNDKDFEDCEWEEYDTHIDWKLEKGDGKKTVYAKFKDAAGNISERVSDSITLSTAVLEESASNTEREENEESVEQPVPVEDPDTTVLSVEEVAIRGKAEEGSTVKIVIKDADGGIVYEGEGTVGEDNEWEILADRSKLPDGTYVVTVESTNKDGSKTSGEFAMEVKGVSDVIELSDKSDDTGKSSDTSRTGVLKGFPVAFCVLGVVIPLVIVLVVFFLKKRKESY